MSKTNQQPAGRNLGTLMKQAPHKKESFWSKLWNGMKKAFGIGSKIIEYAAPLLATRSSSGEVGALRLNSRTRTMLLPSEHVAQMGLANSFKMDGMARPLIRTTKNGYSFIHSGLLTDVEIPADTVRGDLLYRIDISPLMETWLSSMANFEKYRFKHVFITYKPTCSATEQGGLAGVFEWDVDNPLSSGNGEDTIKDVMAHQSAHMSNVWSPATYHFCNSEEPNEEWFVDPGSREKRFTTQGVFSLYAASDFAALSAGQLCVAYEVELLVPEVRSTTHGTHQIYTGKNETVNEPLGDELEIIDPHYSDPLLGYKEILGNVSVRYYTDGGTPAEWGIQIPTGFWKIDFVVQGTNISALLPVAAGEYQALTTDAGVAYINTAVTATLSIGTMLFESSGVSHGLPGDEKPETCVYFTCTATTITNVDVYLTRLHGNNRISYPTASLASAIKRLAKQVNMLPKQLSKYKEDYPTVHEMLSLPLNPQPRRTRTCMRKRT